LEALTEHWVFGGGGRGHCCGEKMVIVG
jgi:hypothetical protein